MRQEEQFLPGRPSHALESRVPKTLFSFGQFSGRTSLAERRWPLRLIRPLLRSSRSSASCSFPVPVRSGVRPRGIPGCRSGGDGWNWQAHHRAYANKREGRTGSVLFLEKFCLFACQERQCQHFYVTPNNSLNHKLPQGASSTNTVFYSKDSQEVGSRHTRRATGLYDRPENSETFLREKHCAWRDAAVEG